MNKDKIAEVLAMTFMFPVYIIITPIAFIMGGIYRVYDLWKFYFTREQDDETEHLGYTNEIDIPVSSRELNAKTHKKVL